MQVNNNYTNPSFGVKVAPNLKEVLTKNLHRKYHYEDAIKDINEQTERLANWGSDFLEISSKKDATTQKDVLILQYKNKNETQTTDLKAIEKRKTRTQILSSFLSLTKKDISRAESNLWQQCTQKDFLSHRTHVKRDTTIQNPIFKRI